MNKIQIPWEERPVGTCRRWTAATPFSAHYALTACPLRFAHAMILYLSLIHI